MVLMRCYEKKHGCRNVHKCKLWGDKIQVGNYVTIFKSEIKASMEGMLENLGLGQRRLKKCLKRVGVLEIIPQYS